MRSQVTAGKDFPRKMNKTVCPEGSPASTLITCCKIANLVFRKYYSISIVGRIFFHQKNVSCLYYWQFSLILVIFAVSLLDDEFIRAAMKNTYTWITVYDEKHFHVRSNRASIEGGLWRHNFHSTVPENGDVPLFFYRLAYETYFYFTLPARKTSCSFWIFSRYFFQHTLEK